MAIDANVLPFHAWAKSTNDPLITKISWALYERGNVLTDMVMANRKTMRRNGARWEGNLPSVDHVDINEEPVVTYGTPTQRQESAHIIRNFIQIDELLSEDENNITNPAASQVKAWTKAFTYKFNDYIVNNNHITGNKKGAVGWRYRLDNTASFGIPSEMKYDAGAVDITKSGITQTTAVNFLESIATVLQRMDCDPSNVTIYCNDTMETRFGTVVRSLVNGAGFDTGRDNYDRPVTTYNKAKIKNIGRTADQTTQIIKTEDSAGVDNSGSNYTSLYFVNHSEEGFSGWQWAPLKARPAFRDDTGVIDRTLLQYVYGFWPEDNRCLARMLGIKYV